jgi:hypothetical protein
MSKAMILSTLALLLAVPALAGSPDVSFQNPSLIVDNYPRTVSVTARNDGDATAIDCQVTITLPSGVSLVSGANPQSVGSIAAGGGKAFASWTVHWPTCQFMQQAPVVLTAVCENDSHTQNTVIWCWN